MIIIILMYNVYNVYFVLIIFKIETQLTQYNVLYINLKQNNK